MGVGDEEDAHEHHERNNGIGSAAERPKDAFAPVRYRGYWFAIDDHDMPSKRLFTFLMFLFTLVETGGKEGAPVVTIPAQ